MMMQQLNIAVLIMLCVHGSPDSIPSTLCVQAEVSQGADVAALQG